MKPETTKHPYLSSHSVKPLVSLSKMAYATYTNLYLVTMCDSNRTGIVSYKSRTHAYSTKASLYRYLTCSAQVEASGATQPIHKLLTGQAVWYLVA